MAVPRPATSKAPVAGKAMTTSKTAPRKNDEPHESEVSRNLRLLRAILATPTQSTDTAPKGRRPKTPLASTTAKQANVARRIPSKGRTGKELVCKKEDAAPESLSAVAEQKKLATNSFNQSLKVVSAVVRKQQLNNQRVAKGEPVGTSSTAGNVEEPELEVHADCACTALDVLRHHDDFSKDCEGSMEKREQGAILLLEKLISLDMKHLAITAASKIYEQYWKRLKAAKRDTTTTRQTSQFELPQLLIQDDTLELRKDFDMACSFQSQVLRLAILLGPESVTQDFVRAVNLDTRGSPARVICLGHDSGYIEKEKAGDSLRTIAQALSRLYSIAVKCKSSGTASEPLALSLFLEAQIIRLASWKTLGRQMDLEQEFWNPVERALSQFWHKMTRKNQDRYEFTRKMVERLHSHARDCLFEPELPPKISAFLAQLAEANDDHYEAAKLLTDLSRQASGSNRLFYQCRLATTQLETDLKDSALSCASKVLESFKQLRYVDLSISSDDLLSLVRLRKACSRQIPVTAATCAERAQADLNVACLRLLFTVLHLCTFQLFQACQKDSKFHRSLYLAVLKTVEAIVDAEQFATATRDLVLHEYMDNLNSCSTSLAMMADGHRGGHQDDQSAVLSSLNIRLSNVFWRAHLNPKVANNDHAAIDLAQKSIACLEGIPAECLGKAALGPRLEKLASMHLAVNASHDAKAVLSEAIQHYIAIDALVDAVEASLSKQSDKVWTDSASLASQLGRALHAYNALGKREEDVEVLDQYLFDDEAMPDIHRAVLLEHQILQLLRKRPEQAVFRVLFRQVQLVMKLACSPQHSIWRLRFACLFTFHATKSQGLNSEDMTKVEELLSSTQVECDDHEYVFLKPYRSLLMSLAQLQHGLIARLSMSDASSRTESLIRLHAVIEGRNSVTELNEVIDNYECLLSTLKAYTDQALALQEDEAAVSCLNAQLHVMRCGVLGPEREHIDCYIKLARSQTRLDDLEAAELSLTKARDLLAKGEPNCRAALEFELVAAEHYLASPAATALDKCTDLLKHAQENLHKLWPQDISLSGSMQMERDSIIARGALLASRLAVRTSCLAAANHYARQAAKISISIWAALQKRKSNSDTRPEGSTVVTLAEDLSKLKITSKPSTEDFLCCGVRYWPYLELHVGTLRHASSISSHAGRFDDALHYIKQLEDVAWRISSSRPSFKSNSTLALLYAKSGRASEAKPLLAADEALLIDASREFKLDDLLSTSEAYIALGYLDAARRLMQRAHPPATVTCNKARVVKIKRAEEETISVTKARRGVAKTRTVKASARRQRNTAGDRAHETRIRDVPVDNTSCFSFNQVDNEDRRKALLITLAASNNHADQNMEHEIYYPSPPPPPRCLVRELFATAKWQLSEAWRKLCADSMQSVITESAVALPSKYIPGCRNGRVSFLQGVGDRRDISPSKIPAHFDQVDGLLSTTQLLQSAHRMVNILVTERHAYCSTEMVHALVKMEARISLLLTTMNQPFSISSAELVLKALQPKDDALDRERMVTLAESVTQDRSSLCIWPTLSSTTTTAQPRTPAELLNDLPSTWSIISLALAADNDELLVSRVISGTSPFLIRIPLRRSNEGGGVDEFVFDDALNEMRDIIKNANSSSHDVRGASDKAVRVQWHADRERLDRRLEILLSNMERVWLGGFRGVLSPNAFDCERITQFRDALNKSLDNHLPSRQKSGSATKKVDIHDHIFEIFLGLPNSDEDDLDDAIIDLLYFVVDILQVNGERNAYDEIDWDAMLVDVLDALRACHKTQGVCPQRHTILVLDKELECFPWESLPCLIDYPVSRMPSLGSIFDRLTHIRAQSKAADALSVSRAAAKFSSVINPSGDLVSTQSMFEPILASTLPAQQYTSLVHTPPTEPQLSSLLSNSDILLYFGHGSGAQYIRGRTIRSLPKSAVTFLFGCSSAKMTEHGSFESTGMPRYYMLGNSPALVGCLWDVTDREIDRVALKIMSEWGLVDGEDQSVREGLRKRGRRSKETQERAVATRGSKKTLIEAVQEGRRACVLPYLCGAAVVAYGVPVVLTE